MNKKRILILGGTGEARELAHAAHERMGAIATIITSLAGRTTEAAEGLIDLPGEVPTGGFGGSDGMVRFIRDERIAAVVDATHPFAAQISKNAKAACDATQTPRLHLIRPEWTPPEGARIEKVASIEAAARLAGKNATRCFLTIGSQGCEAFADLAHVFFLVRTIEGTSPPFKNAKAITQRPPFTVESERALMTKHQIDLLVTKESGGRATEAKIKAAAEMGIPIVMIERPAPMQGDRADTIKDALKWMLERVR